MHNKSTHLLILKLRNDASELIIIVFARAGPKLEKNKNKKMRTPKKTVVWEKV